MPESLVTRPLRTGRNFRVVMPKHRVFLLGWDQAEYEAGAEAELSIQGRHASCKWKFPDEGTEFRFKLRTPDGRFLTSGVALVELSQA
jgi:hypothetical protein